MKHNPVLRAYIIAFSVLVTEGIIYALWHFLQIGISNSAVSNIPIVFIPLINSVFAWWFALRSMNTYEPEDNARKVWRFIMIAMFMYSLGHLLNLLRVYFVFDNNIKPPNISDWLGYIWVPVCLLVALYRKYKLVRTTGKPNTIFVFGQFMVLVIFAVMAALLSPFVSRIFFTLELRLVSLWMIAFVAATLHYAFAILSEIYTGLLSRSWKTLIIAVFTFAVYYVAFFFLFTNNIIPGQHWVIQVLQPALAQITPIFVALAAYFEIEIIG